MSPSWVIVMVPHTYIRTQAKRARFSQYKHRPSSSSIPETTAALRHREGKVPWQAHVPARRSFLGCVCPATTARFGTASTHALLCDGKAPAPPVAPNRARQEQLSVRRCMEKNYYRLAAGRCRGRFSMEWWTRDTFAGPSDDRKISEDNKTRTFVSYFKGPKVSHAA